MARVNGAVQSALPLDLFEHLQQVRSRYACALSAAARGDYSRWQDLRSVSRKIGQFLAEEARRSPEERGGIRLLDLSIEVDRLFPELRGWTEQETLRQQRQRLSGLPAPVLRSAKAGRGQRAS